MTLTFQEGERAAISFAGDNAGAQPALQTEVGQAASAADAASDTPSASSNSFWIMLAMLFVFMYMFVIRPESKRKKQRESFQTSISKGDQVVTAGGLHGTVAALDDATITLKVAENVRLKFDRIAVSRTASAPVEESTVAKG